MNDFNFGMNNLVNANESLKVNRKKAEALLNRFSKYTDYMHGANNPYLNWLNTNPVLTIKQVVEFLKTWYPISRHQPQILLLCMSAFSRHSDRKRHYFNIIEEDGAQELHDPHYFLLQELIKKLDPIFELDKKVMVDGRLEIEDKYTGDEEANEMVTHFHDSLRRKMSSAEASAVITIVEHPALDISCYFHKMIELCGRSDLLQEDLYLKIHCDIEPLHIRESHGTAETYIKNGAKTEVITTFTNGMRFWNQFWKLAFKRLGYPG